MNIVDSADELAAVDLGDRRLNTRARLLAARLQGRPSCSFPDLLGEAELEAHYRFTNNEAVELHKLLKPHSGRSWQRAAEASGPSYVLAVHDTTELSFPGESPRQGLVFTGKRNVLQLHASILVGIDKAPVVYGLAGLRAYVVENHLWGEVQAGGGLQALTSGSDRWRDAAVAARRDAPIGTRIVHVMDREADDYSLWRTIIEQGDDFVIRSANGRRITTSPERYLSAQLQGESFLFGRTAYLSRRSKLRPTKELARHPTRDARLARLHVRAGPVEILRPGDTWRKGLPKTIAVKVVEVVEAAPPEGLAPISWRLLTTLPITTAEEIERVIDIYRKRWLIEEYFKALKTGCSLEDRQAESRWALLNTLGLLAPLAVRLLQLRALGRHVPDAPATEPLDDLELTVLRHMTGGKLPKRPKNRETMMAVARLGGHLRSNGDPGWLVLGRGYAKLLQFVEGWRAAMDHARASQRTQELPEESEM